ncbi:DUF397 domain-containing protein [Streptomyces montanus]|uniref:DUF397 domain-containing protein n=1 Tax=Streptomyces montanus TaxID=2580423 RepID=A0A5R9G0E7_9ACTN|nr:DUF397 domain-containing protein [Streptomyces montanus]
MNAALQWIKSSYSSEQGGDCIEIATRPSAIHIRDSKNPDGPTFTVAPATWTSFLTLTRD